MGGALLVVVFGIPPVVETIADRTARDRLAGRALEVTWRELGWWWSDTVTFRGLEVTAGDQSLRVRRLDVDLALGVASSGGPQPEGIEASGVEGTLDVSGIEAADGEGSSETSDGRDGGVWRARLEQLTRVAVEDLAVRIRRGGRTLAEVTGEGRADVGDGGLEGRGVVRTEVVAGGPEIRWQLDGTVGPTLFEVAGDVRLRDEGPHIADRPWVLVGVGPLEVGLDGFAFDVSLAGGETNGLLVDGPVVRLGGDEAALAFSAPSLLLRRARASEAAWAIGGTDPRVTLDPVHLLEVVSGGGSSGQAGGGGDAGRAMDRRALVERVIETVDVDFRDTHLQLRYGSGDDERMLRPTDSVDIRKRGHRLEARGGFADGTLRGMALWEPGMLTPTLARVRLDQVQLEQVPVIRQGRSLPSRGVRGKIGGRLGLEATLVRVGVPGSLRERMTGLLDVTWRDGWAEADGLAEGPVRGLDLGIDLALDWQPALNRVRLEESRIRHGPVAAEVTGTLADWPIQPVLSVEADFAPFDCQQAVRSLPDALLGPYRHVAIEGEAEPAFGIEIPFRSPSELSLSFDGFPGECSVTALNTEESGWPDLAFEQRPEDPTYGPTASASETRQYAAQPDPPDPLGPPREIASIPETWNPRRPDDVFWLRKPFVKRVTEGVSDDADVTVGPGLASYVPLEAMPPYVAGAAYLSEEIEFYDDGAWNMALIEKALQLNFGEQRFVYGGSTVTQQLVKNLFLTRRKTLARKVQEALVAWRLQGVVSKDRILELYLNCIEFGEDLYGIGPAARRYFDKHASELTPLEAVFLAVIKPAPWYGDRFRERGTTPEEGWWFERITEIMERLVDRGFISEKEAEAAKPYVLEWDEEGEPVSGEGKGKEDKKAKEEGGWLR